jgi:protein gp37
MQQQVLLVVWMALAETRFLALSGVDTGNQQILHSSPITAKEVVMATPTRIEWTEMTWNPVTGCTKLSAGCQHCYAERMAKRLCAMGQARYRNGFRVTLHEDLLLLPQRWKQPRLVFVNSMSDLFHEDVPFDFIRRVFASMAACPQHTFQVPTKRSQRLRQLAPSLGWPANIWMGGTVENDDAQARIEDLRRVPAAVRFLSCEPLLGPLDDLRLQAVQWVIVGGESGPQARPMNPAWVESILRQCRGRGILLQAVGWCEKGPPRT